MNQSKITIVAICSPEDWIYKDEFVKWIRIQSDIPIIIARTVEGGESRKITEENGVSYYDYGFKEFSFSEARNYAISKAETEWIFTLDMDERTLLTPDVFEHILSAPEDVGGFEARLMSYLNWDDNNSYPYDALRVFRKKFKYEYSCHETPRENLERAGYRVCTSPIIIKHHGYNNEEKFKRKLVRNYHLIINDIIKDRTNPKTMGDLYRTLQGIEKWQS